VEISIENKESYINIKIGGQISFDVSGWKQIESARTDVVDTVKKTGIYKLLFDCRELSGKISTIDRFLFAMFLVKENMKFFTTQAPPLKIVFVVDQSMRDAERLGEKVARNRGLRGLVTGNIQEALKWLEVNTPEEEQRSQI
jgi:hypothetical protein